MADETTARRKNSHLDLCASEEVEPAENSTLLECVDLVHCAMPELAISDVDTSASLFGKKLRVPVVVTGMTGGTERAARVNRDLAELAEKHGMAFGVGSQRAMSEDPERAVTFRVRDVAPTTAVIGNIGLRQAAALGGDGVRRLADSIQADGMALHLNVGQELTQPEGDRDFRGGYKTVSALVKVFGERLLVKETGCGISPDVARGLRECGVRTIDISGLGGTSWVRVEELRAHGVAQEVGRAFSGWGIPTAAALLSVRRAVGGDVMLIASGGIRNGLDVVKVLALGANLAGMALPIFRALQEGGREGADRAIDAILTGLKQGLLLTGSRDADQLRTRPKVISGKLKDWLAAL
jgi:isopentenyl-diphosphate Delta-isomerase